MRKLIVSCALLATLISLINPSTAFAEDKCKDDPRECFEFGDDGKVKTKTGKAERTFSMPPIKAGFIIDFRYPDVLPHIAVEVVEFDLWKNLGTFSVDTGIANSRVFAALNWEVIPIAKVGPSIWVGYNVKEQEPTFGIGISILDF